MTQLASVLIANRGEIAVRIARTARDLGIRSIAVYTEADAESMHAAIADEAYAIPSYLDIPALIDVALRTGASCVHPGYGFLSENADFARAVQDAGLVWVGPSPEAIETLGNKISARALAREVNAPLAPGTEEPISDWQDALAFAEEHGLPIAIKAAFGRSLTVVRDVGDIEHAFASASREAQAAFGRSECFVEKFLPRPRHVEAQVLADALGNIIVLSTRDCSVQRRFHKLIEEAPAPFLSEWHNSEIIEGARAICRAADYTGAGTVEFIVAADGTISFLDFNTRIQVEHPITEAITGIDIVAEQFRIAAGHPLSVIEDPVPTGHAFEFRINAEDIAHGFVPSPGTITAFEPPTGPGLRIDSGVRTGSPVSGTYDSLLAKLIVTGPTRAIALLRARDALKEFSIRGVRTTLPFHRDMVEHPSFAGSDLAVYTDWVDHNYQPGLSTDVEDIASLHEERMSFAVEVNGRLHQVTIPASSLMAEEN
ncbi:Biotin carboxylase [Corynebacterium atrinae]|uniref:acetyl-CoA carboxylase biotin carboxylase subunit n=1 Tax=Corynebacterium atrinae TaxID=1336740 RepID=UPI00338E7D68|nr:Biotin carboxylase [Corynebacterium atrinae]